MSKPVRLAPPPNTIASAASCLNCGEDFEDKNLNFCPQCGQETNVRPPRLVEFAQQLGGAYFSTEGALWRTLRLLVLRPGELTRQYLAGRRKHFVLPLRLYLTISVASLLILKATGGLGGSNLDDVNVTEALKVNNGPVEIRLGWGHASMKDGKLECEELPGWLCHRLQQRLTLEPTAMLKELHDVKDRMTSNWSAVMFVLMPSFALGLAALYRNRGLRYTEHLVAALHLHAFWFIVIACMRLGGSIGEAAGPWVIVGYGGLSMRRVYGGRWLALGVRLTALSVAYASLILLAVVVLAVVALLA